MRASKSRCSAGAKPGAWRLAHMQAKSPHSAKNSLRRRARVSSLCELERLSTAWEWAASEIMAPSFAACSAVSAAAASGRAPLKARMSLRANSSAAGRWNSPSRWDSLSKRI